MGDWAAVREQFPATKKCAYLNTAAGGPMSHAVAEAGAGYYRSTLDDGDVHWDGWMDRVDKTRGCLADYLSCSAGELAFVGNASVGINMIAQMTWGQGKVIAVRGDFPSVTLPWMQLGYEVTFVDPDEDGAVPVERLAAAADAETALLALGSVHYQSGFRHDLRELGRMCHDSGLLLAVDATQQAGALPIDLSGDDVDFLVASGYKWLTAGYGVGFMYVNRRHLHPEAFPAVGWRSARLPYELLSDRLDLADNAAALELGNPPFAGVFCLGAALEMFERLGPENVGRRVLELSGDLIARLRSRGIDVVTSSDDRRRAGIVSARVESPAAMKSGLADHSVLVSARGDVVRMSTHLFNDTSDLDRLEAALDDLA